MLISEQQRAGTILLRIEINNQSGNELADNELGYLYKIAEPFAPLAFEPRVRAVLFHRNVKKDVSRILDCDEDQVTITQEDFLEGFDIKFHYGSIDLSHLSLVKNLKFPLIVRGDVNLNNIKDIQDLKLPQIIGDRLSLDSLINAKGVIFPQIVGENLGLDGLISAKGLKLPQKVYGVVYLGKLNTSEDLEIPLGVKRISLRAMSNSEIEKIKKRFPHVEIIKR